MTGYPIGYEGILICTCRHGKPHHKTEFGNCFCPIGQYSTKTCNCQSFQLSEAIYRGKRYTPEQYYEVIDNDRKEKR